jgi:hypothetical protein
VLRRPAFVSQAGYAKVPANTSLHTGAESLRMEPCLSLET